MWTTDVVPRLKAAIDADREFAFAHTALGLITHAARNMHFRSNVEQCLTAARQYAKGISARERLYIDALDRAHQGDITGSVACYETILRHHPRDIFAQRFAQLELFWLGEMHWSEDISSRIAEAWDETIPGYNIHLSCRAFDLEETGSYGEAERIARQAVDLEPADCWGTHAVAHVLFMQNRNEEGIAWLDGLKGNWADANQIKLHLWWHRCLFHLERSETDAVLSIYDDWIRNRDLAIVQSMPDLYIDMQNGASMLLRLEHQGVDVGARWNELCELTLDRIGDHSSPFTSPHFAAILAACGQLAKADELVQQMRDFAEHDEGTFGPRYRTAAIPAAEAAIAHRKGDYARAIEALLPARRLLWQMGGSHAQRDVIHMLLIDSAKRLGRKDIVALGLRDLEANGFTAIADRANYRDAAKLVA